MKFVEHSKRAFIKTITYRILIVISTFLVTYIATREVKMTLGITVGATLINTILYFIHERVWNGIQWGKST